eukprot:PhM_4_TR17829/c0_g1_i1/m.68924
MSRDISSRCAKEEEDFLFGYFCVFLNWFFLFIPNKFGLLISKRLQKKRGLNSLSLVAHVARRAVEAICVHQTRPRRCERRQEVLVVRCKVTNVGQVRRVVHEVDVRLQRDNVPRRSNVHRLAGVGIDNRRPLARQQRVEVRVAENVRAVERGDVCVAQTTELAGAAETCLQGHVLRVRQRQTHLLVLHVLQRHGVVAHHRGQVHLGDGRRGVGAAAAERDVEGRVRPGGVAQGDVASKHNRVGPREVVAVLVLDGRENVQGLVHGDVRGPRALRREADAGAVAATDVVGHAERRGALPRERREDSAVVRSAVLERVGRERRVLGPHRRGDVIGDVVEVRRVRGSGGQRVLELLRRGHPRAGAARDGAHVARDQLVPRVLEVVLHRADVIRVLLHETVVHAVDGERDVCGQHDDGRGVARGPLVVPAGALGLAERLRREGAEVLVGPLRRRRRPRALEAAREGAVGAQTRPGVRRVLLRRGAGARGARAVCLPERVAAADERNGLRVVHAHRAERETHFRGTARGVRHAHGALRVDVDESDRGSAERRDRALAVDGARVPRLLLLRGAQQLAPVAVVVVDASAAEAEHGAAHGLNRGRAREDNEVAPRQTEAVLLLDGPQQRLGLVEVGVVGPAQLGVETLTGAVAAAEAVGAAVRPRAVPRLAHEEGPVVAVVSGPERLRLRQERFDVLLDRVPVQRGERLAVGGDAVGVGRRRHGGAGLGTEAEGAPGDGWGWGCAHQHDAHE